LKEASEVQKATTKQCTFLSNNPKNNTFCCLQTKILHTKNNNHAYMKQLNNLMQVQKSLSSKNKGGKSHNNHQTVHSLKFQNMVAVVAALVGHIPTSAIAAGIEPLPSAEQKRCFILRSQPTPTPLHHSRLLPSHGPIHLSGTSP